jgi:hypothetical protein
MTAFISQLKLFFSHLAPKARVLLKPEYRWVLGLILTLLVAPLMTQAGVGEAALSALNFLLKQIEAMAGWLLELAGQFLGYVLSPEFNNLKLTSGGIVDVGWELTRQLANMFFIVALLIIAFATILDLESYGMRKLLPRLIAMILLVNFSKVIAGIIVDASRIVMNLFLSASVAADSTQSIPLQLANLMHVGELFEPGKGILDTFTKLSGAGSEAQILGAHLFGIIFMGLAAWIFFVLALLFIGRIVAIWVLTILAPVAFLLGTMPPSSPLGKYGIGYWFQLLIQWSFIGAVAAFFIYMAALLAAELNRQGAAIFGPFNPENIELTPQYTAFIGNFAPFLIFLTILVFLYIGYKLSLAISATGSREFVGAVTGWSTRAAKWTGKLSWGGVRGTARGVESRAISSGLYGAAATGLAKSRLPGAKRAALAIQRRIGKAREEAEKIEKALSGGSSAMVRAFSRSLNPMHRLVGTKIEADRGIVTREGAAQVYPLAQRIGGDFRKSIEKAVPSIKGKPVAETFAGITPSDFAKIVPEEISYYFATPERRNEVRLAINARQIQMLGREGGLPQKKALLKGYAQLTAQQITELPNDIKERLGSSAYATSFEEVRREGPEAIRQGLTRIQQAIEELRRRQERRQEDEEEAGPAGGGGPAPSP